MRFFNASNIFDVKDKKLLRKSGGFVTASIRTIGSGWDVLVEYPLKTGKGKDSDRLIKHHLAEGVDVFTACRILNDMCVDINNESVINLSHCLSRDLGNAIQKRMKNYG